jgi:peroxiredoxin
MSVREDHPLIGAEAPYFELESAEGDRVALSRHRGRIVVLFFVREFS